MRTFGLLFIVLFTTFASEHYCRAQSFTQTIGGVSAQDGIGAMPTPTGYLVGVRDHDPQLGRHVGRSYGLSATGSLQSTVELPLNGSVFLQGMATVPNGIAFQFGSVLPGSGNEHQGLVVKFNDQGDVTWTALDSLSGSVQYFGATGLPDGGVVVCGVVEGPTGHDAMISRFGPNGEQLWTRVLESLTDEEAYAIAADGTDVIVTGRSVNFGGTSDMLFAKLDLDGGLVWTTTWGGTAMEEARAIVAMGNGQFVAAGWTTSFGAFNPTLNTVPPHSYLIAIDLQGDTLWTRSIGDADQEHRTYALAIAPNGDLLTGGEVGTTGRSDALFQRFTSTGSLVWERTVDTGKEERLVHILPLPDGLVATGRSFGEFGRQLLFIRRNSDGF